MFNWQLGEMPENSTIYRTSSRDESIELDDPSPQDIGEMLGFRVTGGRDFYMPLTIFHVKENSRAEKANLKLGDAIISVNGRDTSNMTLVEANRFLAKVSDGDVTLQVAKFDNSDDDDDSQTIEEVILEGPASLEQKLRMMQKQLLEMTDIPVQIQSKIAMVTKALEQFMTMDSEALESTWKRTSSSIERETSQEVNSEKQFLSIPEEDEENEREDIESQDNINELNSENFDHFDEHSTRETSFSLDDLEEQYKKFQDNDEATDVEKSQVDSQEDYYNDDDDEDDDEKSICESVKSEEMLKLEAERKKKNEKILKLEKSWQKLCSNTKTIHKRSNCHLVPSVALINNKISQLNESKVISFYARKRHSQDD